MPRPAVAARKSLKAQLELIKAKKSPSVATPQRSSSPEQEESEQEESDEELAMELAALASIQAEKRAKQNKLKPVGDHEDESENSQEEDEEVEEENELGSPRPEKVYSNDKAGMARLLDQIKYPDALPWEETMVVTTSEPVEVNDVNNDLERELAIYAQAKACVLIGRGLVKKAGLPFSRPDDYYAETVKSDAHMFKVRQKMADELGAVKAAEEARRQRELRKFGKKVQVEKLAERQKKKSAEEEKIKAFKKKRKGADLDTATAAGDEFDVGLADDDTPSSRGANKRQKSADGKPNHVRNRKDAKYGFGGKKKHAKANTAESSADFSGFDIGKNKSLSKGVHGGAKTGARNGIKKATRPGKGRRMNGRK